jgi:hypothetical protein
MGGQRRRIEPTTFQEWKDKLEIWEILVDGNLAIYLEKLKGSNPSITK